MSHEEWLAHGGCLDGVSLDERGSSEDEPLVDLSYPPYKDETVSDCEGRWRRVRNEVGTPVPEYSELPPYEP